MYFCVLDLSYETVSNDFKGDATHPEHRTNCNSGKGSEELLNKYY